MSDNPMRMFAEEWKQVSVYGGRSLSFESGDLCIGVQRAGMSEPCGCRSEWPEITPLMVETARLIDEFHDLPNCGVGGPLHIVTDDSNVEDHHLSFCWGAVFDELGPKSQGWWREGQSSDELTTMERMGCAILWGLGSMTIPERYVVADGWGRPLEADLRLLAPHQGAYLVDVEWGFQTERPGWVCDACWDRAHWRQK